MCARKLDLDKILCVFAILLAALTLYCTDAIILTATPNPAEKNEAITFTAVASDSDIDLDSVVLECVWNFGDNKPLQTTNEPSVNYSYSDVGTYTVTVDITIEGEAVTFSGELEVAVLEVITPPVASLTADLTTAEPWQTINFDARGSTASTGAEINQYVWDFDNGRIDIGDSSFTSEDYTSEGIYTVLLTVSDTAGRSASTSLTITIDDGNDPPFAVITPKSTNAEVGERVSLSGSESNDPDDDSLEFFWDIASAPSGSTAELDYDDETKVSTYFFPNMPGDYVISLGVKDSAGNYSMPDYASVTVSSPTNLPPVADAGGSPDPDNSGRMTYWGVVNAPVAFNGNGSYDPDGEMISYSWNFGDGPIQENIGPEPEHPYSGAGTYEVTLTVSDGELTGEDTVFVIITENTSPVADAGGPYRSFINGTIEFNGTGSYDDDGDPLIYDWDFGDGNIEEDAGATPTNSYLNYGTYLVTLTVSDGYAQSVDYATVLIRALPDTGQDTFYTNDSIICSDCSPDDPTYSSDISQFRRQDAAYDDGILFEWITDESTGETIVHDMLSDLYWEADTNEITDYNRTLMTYSQAEQHCVDISNNAFGGYDDWRLPGRSELITTVNYGSVGEGDFATFPLFQSNTADGAYWTSSPNRSDYPENPIIISFGGYASSRGSSYATTTDSNYTRCVRGEPLPAAHDFFDNLDGTITDQTTGYMWTKVPYGDGFSYPNWQDALEYCYSLPLGSYTDWRLPNIKQLETLTDFSQITSPVINPIFFDLSDFPEYSKSFWSSTTVEGSVSPYIDDSEAWILNFTFEGNIGGSMGKSLGYAYGAFCVRKITE